MTTWPGTEWATGPQVGGSPSALGDALDAMFATNPNPNTALSLACVIVQGGRIIAERYGPDTDASSTLISWSTAKSITHAAVGIAVADGVLDIDAPLGLAAWGDSGDKRRSITLRHLLAMRSGLEFNEDYLDGATSHCLEMLFGPSSSDMAAYAAAQPLAHPIDSVFNYSSGTTNIVSRALSDAYGFDGPGLDAFLRSRLFEPLGMDSAVATFDAAGTFIGSSYVHATARDFARFGYLYLSDGVWNGTRILPQDWVDYARTVTSVEAETGLGYGAHWWVWGDEVGTFAAQGYEGQLIAVIPALDVVIVRLGKTPVEHRDALMGVYRDLIAALR